MLTAIILWLAFNTLLPVWLYFRPRKDSAITGPVRQRAPLVIVHNTSVFQDWGRA